MPLTAAELKAALSEPGLINEDVMQEVQNLDEGIPQPLMNLAGTGSFSNNYSEWTEDDLTPPDTDNAVVDGAPTPGNDAKVGRRVGNHGQLSDKVVRVSDISDAVDSIGNQGTMAYQKAKRLMDLRRDQEAIACGRQASVADDGTSTPGRTAGLAAWLTSNVDTSGSVGGFNNSTKVVDAPTVGAKRALAWETVRDVLESAYINGANPSYLMSVAQLTKRINSFLFSDAGAPYRAAPTAEVTGTSPATQTAQGYISTVLTDFGITLTIVPNRLQQTYNDSLASPCADLFLLDPAYFQIATLFGYKSKRLGSEGHSEGELLSVSWMTKMLREDAHAAVFEVDHLATVTAS